MSLVKTIRTVLAAMLLLLGTLVRADVLVLVHGWASAPDTWWVSGVMPVLSARGWQDAGVVSAGPPGIAYFPLPGERAGNKIYRVGLSAEAPLLIQTAQLLAELDFIRRRHPDEPLYLAGHSAGGLVARLALVSGRAPAVRKLITIATPNLGTGRALQGLDVVDSKPFFCPGPGIDFLKSVIGGDDYRYVRDSRGALVDMVPAAPGSLLGWLNSQPHPAIEYHAVIHEGPGYAGDWVAPAGAQDLNQVPVLRGRAAVHPLLAPHTLMPADGTVLADILGGQ